MYVTRIRPNAIFLAAILIAVCVANAIAQSATDSLAAPLRDSLASVKKAPASAGDSSAGARKNSFPAPVAGRVFDTLSGPLPDVVKSSGRPFLVVGDIEVAVGKTVTIGAGTILLFKNFTGLHVIGRLIVEGTKDAPVIFTSENDRSVNHATNLFPNPYDWNGIYIHSDAVGSSFAYCKVEYSVYGIVSETKFIKLNPVVLQFNGKSNLVIEGKEQQVTDKPYRYVLSTKDVAAEGVPVKILTDPLAPRRNALRYGGIVLGMAASVAAVYYGLQWNRDQTNLNAISTDAWPAIYQYNGNDWLSRRNKRNNDMYITAACGVVALLGYIGFGWSFAF
jgi:hypothetical protein